MDESVQAADAIDLALGSTRTPITNDRSVVQRVIDFANDETTFDAAAARDVGAWTTARFRETGKAPTTKEIATQSAAAERSISASREDARGHAWLMLRYVIDGDFQQFARGARAFSTSHESIVRRPTMLVSNGSVRVRFELEGPPDPGAWIDYASMVLLANEDGVADDLKQCQLEACGRFFLVERLGRGKPRTKYCCDEHMTAAHSAASPERSRKKRANDKAAAAAKAAAKRKAGRPK